MDYKCIINAVKASGQLVGNWISSPVYQPRDYNLDRKIES